MRTVLVIGVAVLLAGCQRPETIAGVSDSAFVRAMAELRRLPTTPAIGQAARDRARDSILRLHGITAAQLEAARAEGRREAVTVCEALIPKQGTTGRMLALQDAIDAIRALAAKEANHAAAPQDRGGREGRE